jgi:hypothetical protein
MPHIIKLATLMPASTCPYWRVILHSENANSNAVIWLFPCCARATIRGFCKNLPILDRLTCHAHETRRATPTAIHELDPTGQSVRGVERLSGSRVREERILMPFSQDTRR